MQRKYLVFVALAITILYGAGFAVVDDPASGYAPIGGAVIAIAWIAVGIFGRDDRNP